jgi:hypothetical protein
MSSSVPVPRPRNTERARERRVDRYYDTSTDQFLSVDPEVAKTGQPYAFTSDDPLNETDPLGLISAGTVCGQHGTSSRACKGAIKIQASVTKAECKNDPGACGKYTCGRFAIQCWYPLGIAAAALLCVAFCPAAAATAGDAATAAAKQAAESGLRKIVNSCLVLLSLCLSPANTTDNTPVQDLPDQQEIPPPPSFPQNDELPYRYRP